MTEQFHLNKCKKLITDDIVYIVFIDCFSPYRFCRITLVIIGVEGLAYDWFNSYFSDRKQVTCVGMERSAELSLTCSVPQGSVLGPKSFMAYAEDVEEIFDSFEVRHQLYADDMQSHAHSKPSECNSFINKLQECAVAVSDWCRSKRLQLNRRRRSVCSSARPSIFKKYQLP